MSAPNNFQVDPAQIREHANTVSGIASGLSSAGGGLPGEPAENALGTFVQFLTAGLGTAMTQATDAIALAASAMDDVSAALVRTAEDYQRSDEHNAALLLGKDSR
ncbi:type VII secretion target [Saccharopolyspora hattusasensis]|uniref:type VII secretion target n=1 Tax=Saccharopolyspora hattusasensis TaxID=1128679 RepID=UPI003D991BA3